jgi:hypothetical protein
VVTPAPLARPPRARRRSALLAAALLLGACTTVGRPDSAERARHDYGERAQIRVCVLRDAGVSEARARQLLAAVDREMDAYAIDVSVPWTKPWRRPGFTVAAIMDELRRQPLPEPCDRLLALVSRHLGDALWGIFLPETLGAVETASHTRGYVVARSASLNQLISPPEQIAQHEFYHMLGCGHALSLRECYGQIAELKRSHDPAADFFPGLGPERQLLRSRDEVPMDPAGSAAPLGAR